MGIIDSLPIPIPNHLISDDESKTNINNNNKPIDRKHLIPKHYTTVSYGPINVRVSHRSVPTLRTGRRSKFLPLEGEAARKREIRRRKNRETARKLKEKRINIERQLIDEIHQLESHEKNLAQEISYLKSYKQLLENDMNKNYFCTDNITGTIPIKLEYY